MINTGLTGHVVITDNEIMIMDTTDKATAVEVWRYNINGFGYSNTGYNGPFIGLTKDGKLLVTEATANKFTAALINAGVLQSVDGSSWFNLDDGTFSWANGAIVYDGNALTINVGGHDINDMLDATFNVLVNHEHQIIQLDSNYFPVNNGSYEFTFTVLKENSTVETPCLVTGITPHVPVDGISFKMNNNTCTMMVDKTKRLLNIKESFFDVTLEVLDYTLTKRLTWSVSVNGRDGEDGVNGAPGTNGKDGVNSYFHIKYSEVPNPTSSSQMLETPSFYIGTYVDSIQTDSNDPTKYTWSRFRGIDGNDGEDGIPGVNGKDGITYYIHIKYSDDGKTFTANNGETPGKYLGQLVDTTKEDSLVFNAYTWKKIEGDPGTNASYVRISNNGQVFLKAKSATTFTPASITLTPVFTNATYSNWQYSVDNTSTWNNVTSGQNGLTISGNKLTVASNSALFTSTVKSILFKVNCTNGVSDTITLVRIEEGKDGVDGVDGSNGTNGKDGKGIKSVANYYLASSSSSGVTVSTSGWTTTVQNISTSKKYLWNYELVTYTDNSTYTTTPTIIGVHGTDGTNGTNGTNGKGIKSITEYYVLSTTNSGVTTSTSGWSTTVPTLTPTNKYLWNYEKITYTDNSTTSTTPVIIGVYGDKGLDGTNGTNGKDGKGIKSVVNYYLASASSSDVTASTTGWTTTVQNISTSKKYLWNYELVTYTDNSTYTTTPTIIGVHGTNGTNGKGIKSVTEYYVLSTTNTGVTTATSGWSTTVPTLTATKKYLWNYEKITYTDNSTTNTTPAIIGVYGDKGDEGATPNYNLIANSHNMGGVFSSAGGYKGNKTLVKDVDAQCGYHVECKCTTAGSGPHFPVFPKTSDKIGNTYTWSFWAKASVAKTSVTCGHESGGRKYINLTTSWQKFTNTWTYTDDTYHSFTFYANDNWKVGEVLYIKDFKIEMGDKATTWLPTVDEIKGVGIKNIVNYYLASSSSSGVTVSTSGWTTTVQNISTTNKYLWNYELVTYSDNTTYSTPPMIIGVHGTNGTNGTNGKGIKSVTEYYLLSTNKTGITTSTTGWSTTIPTLTATNKYMWNYEKITYTDNSTTNTTPAIIGVYGDKGNDGANGKDGKGVNTITNYYLASSSSSGVTTSTSGWTTTVQSMTSTNKYLWNYEVIAYTDGTNTTTTPTIIGVHGTNGTNGTNGKGISSITEYYLATSSSSGVTTSTSGWTTTVQSMTSTNKYLWNYEVIKYTDNSTTTGSPKIIGVYGDKGATGANAVNVLLSNESHTFAASSNGAAVAGNVTTNVIGYKGSTATACTVGTISGLPTGMTAKINNNGSTSASITFTVTTSLTTKAGTVTIPVTCGGVTVNKIFSYSLAVAGINGTNGTNGTNAKLIKINASTNVFKSTDGGVTFAPTSISLIPAVQNVSFSKWQYSTNGSSFTDVTSGSHGLTVNGSTLVIAVSSDLFTDTSTTLALRAVSSTSSVYDTLTIYKLYDRTDINDAFEEMELTVSQSNTKWEAAFKNANANNLLLNSDAKTGTTDNWVDNGGGISALKANAFPFYGSIEYYFYTTFPYGMRYAHDIPLEPNTDYVYEGYIFTNTALTGTNVTPLHFWIWTGDTPTSTRLCTIVDYRQTMTKGRFVKCYIHFKTNNVTEALHGRFFIYHTGTSSSIGVKRMSLKKGTIESEWTQHPNEVKSIVTSIDKDGVKVKHSEAGTYTQMDSTGFSIRESGTDEALAWLSSKKQWTELKVDKLFAGNVENVYVGDGNLYVNHSATVAGDGTADAPFNSFRQLKEYLEATPVINKNLSITVMDPGDEINEQLNLQNLGGVGDIKITLEDTVIIRSPGDQQACIQLEKMPTKWVCIAGGREFGSATTGAVLCDNPNNSAGGHGIKASEIGRLEVDALSIACKNWGIKVDCTNLFTWQCDFGKCYTAIELTYQSMYFSSDDVGSNTKFAVLKSGSLMYFGVGSAIPQGSIDRINGIAYKYASIKPSPSTRYSIANPDAPLGSQTHTYTYHWTSHKSYNYELGNWSEDDCKQGYWGHGEVSGHMFFDLTTLRKQMAGTVINSNTITLTRSNTGGNSGEVHIYLHGSTCSSASGTPSYGDSSYLGALALGETKTFTLNVNIVQGLVSGRFNSIAMYVNSNDNNYYINIVDASITLKVLK